MSHSRGIVIKCVFGATWFALPASMINQNHTNCDEDKCYNKAWTKSLSQDQNAADKYTKNWSEKRKGMEETDRVAVNQFEPEEITEESNYDALIKH